MAPYSLFGVVAKTNYSGLVKMKDSVKKSDIVYIDLSVEGGKMHYDLMLFEAA